MVKKQLILFLVVVGMLVGAPLFGTGTQEGTSGEPVELTYWEMQWGPAESYQPAVNMLVEKFNAENPNINVTVQHTPWSNWYQTFVTAITSGAAPDVSTGAFPQDVMYAQMGEILALDSLVEEWQNENNPILKDFVPGSLELHRYDGHQVGIPWNADPRLVHYRKSYFADAGLGENLKDWEAFLGATRKLKTSSGKYPMVFPVGDHGPTQVMLNVMFTNGIGIVDKNINVTFDSPEVMQVMRGFFGVLADEELVPPGIAGYTGADAQKTFFSDNALLYMHAPLQGIWDYPAIADDTAVLPPFRGPGRNGKPRNLTWLNSMMAYTQSDHPEEGKAFIKWWSENNLPLWTEGHAGPFPARLSYTKDPYFSDQWLSREIAEKVMSTSVSPVWPAEVLYPEFAQIEGENYVGMTLQEIYAGNRDYEGIQKKITGLIKKAFE
jgi:multiple sugar transport system substrate-binding protein